jgi:hypothetical protein
LGLKLFSDAPGPDQRAVDREVLAVRQHRAMRNSSMWPLKGSAMPFTRALAFVDPELLGRDLDRAPPPEPGGGATPSSRSRDNLLSQAAIQRYPIRKVTTPVPVEGGVAGGALPMSAGTRSMGAGSRTDRRSGG